MANQSCLEISFCDDVPFENAATVKPTVPPQTVPRDDEKPATPAEPVIILNPVTAPLLIAYDIKNRETFKSSIHPTVYATKTLALKGLEEAKNPDLHMITEDSSLDGKKRFYNMTYNDVYKLSSEKIYNLYESIERNEPVKLYMDIDCKVTTNTQEERDTILYAHVETAINDVNTALLKQKVHNQVITSEMFKIIVIHSSSPTKVSAHIIYQNVTFDDVYSLKFFMANMVESQLYKDKIIDPLVYKVGCFRMLWNSKRGKGVILDYTNDDLHNIGYTYKNRKTLFMDCLIKNIPANPIKIPIQIPNVEQADRINKLNKVQTANTINAASKKLYTNRQILADLVMNLNKGRADNYNDWIAVGMAIKNSNPTDDGFYVYNEFSKQSDSYDNIGALRYKWNSFQYRQMGGYSFFSLVRWLRKDNHTALNNFYKFKEESMFTSTKMNKNYLLDGKEEDGELVFEDILSSKSPFSGKVREWMDSTGIKSLCIKSPYDTGKTNLLQKLFIAYKNKLKTILVVTYRQSLSNNMVFTFTEYGFKSYMDKKIKIGLHSRVICQVESLEKVLAEDFWLNNQFKSYDLVVFDEIESTLNHISSPTHGVYQKHNFHIMLGLAIAAKKLIFLDGDYGNRAHTFVKFLGKSIVIENTVKKSKRNFKFTHDFELFKKKIDDSLKAGLNIAIPSMPAKPIAQIYNHYKDKYKCVLHHANVGDDVKEKLKNVTKEWKVNLLMYSPSVESGVDFSETHFDKMFVILSVKSCSPRALCQMMSRVRKLKSNDIDVYLNNIPFLKSCAKFRFDEVKDYMMYKRNMFAEFTSYLDQNDKPVVKTTIKFGLFEELCVYNEIEKLHSQKNFFIPIFTELLESKGHTCEFIKMEPKCSNCQPPTAIPTYGNPIIGNIYCAPNIDKEACKKLLIKQRNNEASAAEKNIIAKHVFMKSWGIEILEPEFFDKFYGKTDILLNLRVLLGVKIKDPAINSYLSAGKNLVDQNVDRHAKIKIVKNLVTTLGFDFKATEVVDQENFLKNRDILVRTGDLFTDPIHAERTFGLSKHAVSLFLTGRKSTMKQYLGLFNTILGHFGMRIKTGRKHRKENRKIVWDYGYTLSYIDQIDRYV
jgi:hypothetical protein